MEEKTGREHGRSSYQHTLDTFINARRATGIRWRSIRISCVRQAAKQRVKCSSFSDLPSFCLALLCPCLPSLPLTPPRLPSRMLRVATAKVKTFRVEMLALAKPRRVAKPNRRDSQIVEISVPLMIRRHVKCSLSISMCAPISRYKELIRSL